MLFRCDPEWAHHAVLFLIKYYYRPSVVRLARKCIPKIPVKVFGLEFENPVGLAAGFDNNADAMDSLFGMGFGFVEIGGVTPKPQSGNPKPRLFRIPKAFALINRMGFDNKGIDYVVERLKKRSFSGVMGINIGKNKDTPLEKAVEDYQYCLIRAYPYVDYVTVNISSPNTPGLRELQTEFYLKKLVAELKRTQESLSRQYVRYVPLLVKISVDLSDPELEAVIRILMEFAIDGITVANTSLDHQAVSDYRFGLESGGLSGKPIFQKSTEMLRKIHQMANGKLSIVGLGGIFSAEDAQAKFDAGAKLVQIYTGLIYQGPCLVKKIIIKLKNNKGVFCD